MKVKFKAGRFWPTNFITVKLYTAWYTLRAKITGKKIKVKLTYNYRTAYIAHDPNEAMDWYKVLGTKSGVVTKTNQELIFAMRCPGGDQLDFAMYHRDKERHWSTDVRSVELTTWGGFITYTIDPIYGLPVGPYNGGTYPAMTDNSYDIKLYLTD